MDGDMIKANSQRYQTFSQKELSVAGVELKVDILQKRKIRMQEDII